MNLSSKIFSWVFGVILALILIAKGLTLWTDYLWFGVMDQSSVFSTILWTRVKLGVVVGALLFGWLYLNLRIARKPLPADITLIGKRLMPEEERAQIEGYADRGLLIFALAGGLMAGLVASGKWLPWLQYTHAVDFGQVDPLFGRDVGFYVFKLTFLRYVYNTVFYSVIIATVCSVLVHLYQETIRIAGSTIQTISRSRAHIYGLVALALIVKVFGYRLDQLGLVLANRGGVFSGASYADVHGRMPVMYALMVLCVVAAGVILANVRSRRLFWPAGSLAVILLFSLLGGTTYPALVQKFVVVPNQLAKERPFIEHNIAATNSAFGLETVTNKQHYISTDLTWDDIQNNRETIDNIRLWDHRPLERTMDQTQALRAYYDFPDVDVDRYTVDGRYRQVMIAPRQIDSAKIPQPRTWVKDRLQYTHGYGVCAAPVNEISRAESDEGLPNYWVKDIPPQAIEDLAIDRAGVYYFSSIQPRLIEIIQAIDRSERAGQQKPPPGASGGGDEQAEGPDRPGAAEQRLMDEPMAEIEQFVLVNTDEQELDFPRVDGGNAYTKYEGKGGVPVGSFLRRLAFFARFHDLKLLLTQSITKDSKVMINRTLPERMQALCPMFAICDPDPYITIIDGKLVWINDVYTYSTMYPYSTMYRKIRANYMRNSVKAVCDAYDGIVRFHVVDNTDPLIQCYQKIFPTLFKSEPLPAKVREHIRYPQLLFIVQSEMYADYHMLDAETFYQREDSWSTAREMYGSNRESRMVEAYYVVMKLPGEDKEEFLLMVPLTLRGREDRNMVAWMAARCDGENYGELLCYRMPKSLLVDGPGQVEARIGQNREFSKSQTLWGQEGSSIIRGNLLVIPIAKSLLYVEPIYLAASNSAIPELKMVVVVSNQRVALGDDLEDALHKLFGRTRSAQKAPAEAAGPEAGPEPDARALPQSLVELIDRMVQLDAQATKALATGNLGEYQDLHKQMAELLKQAQETAQ